MTTEHTPERTPLYTDEYARSRVINPRRGVITRTFNDTKKVLRALLARSKEAEGRTLAIEKQDLFFKNILCAQSHREKLSSFRQKTLDAMAQNKILQNCEHPDELGLDVINYLDGKKPDELIDDFDTTLELAKYLLFHALGYLNPNDINENNTVTVREIWDAQLVTDYLGEEAVIELEDNWGRIIPDPNLEERPADNGNVSIEECLSDGGSNLINIFDDTEVKQEASAQPKTGVGRHFDSFGAEMLGNVKATQIAAKGQLAAIQEAMVTEKEDARLDEAFASTALRQNRTLQEELEASRISEKRNQELRERRDAQARTLAERKRIHEERCALEDKRKLQIQQIRERTAAKNAESAAIEKQIADQLKSLNEPITQDTPKRRGPIQTTFRSADPTCAFQQVEDQVRIDDTDLMIDEIQLRQREFAAEMGLVVPGLNGPANSTMKYQERSPPRHPRFSDTISHLRTERSRERKDNQSFINDPYRQAAGQDLLRGTRNNGSSSQNPPSAGQQEEEVKPVITKIPEALDIIGTFNGDPFQFSAFMTRLKEVMDNSTFSATMKNTVLIRCLTGNAAKCISGADDQKAAYDRTVKNLEDSFGSATETATSLLDRYEKMKFDQFDPHEMNINISEHVNMVENLADKNILNPDTIPVLMNFLRKLPPSLYTHMRRFVASTKDCTFKEMVKELRFECNMLKNVPDFQQRVPVQTPSYNEIQQGALYHQQAVTSDNRSFRQNSQAQGQKQRPPSKKSSDSDQKKKGVKPDGDFQQQRKVLSDMTRNPWDQKAGPRTLQLRYTIPELNVDENKRCPLCGPGHAAPACPLLPSEVRSRIEKENRCALCGHQDHKRATCKLLGRLDCIHCCGYHLTSGCFRREDQQKNFRECNGVFTVDLNEQHALMESFRSFRSFRSQGTKKPSRFAGRK